MAAGVNRVILLGNLGKDPEIRHLEGGRLKASFPLATNEIYKNREGQKVNRTEWHYVVLWSRLAEVAEKYLSKGKQIYIEGKLSSRSYEDKEGQIKYTTEIIGQSMLLIGHGKGNLDEADSADKDEMEILPEDTTDNLPF